MGTESASSRGELLPSEVAIMSKHSVKEHEKLSSVYMTELFPPTLRVMAGFPKDGGYFVPHTHINVIVYTQKHGKDPIDLIFPLYQVWKQQQSDPTHADQNICAHYYCLKHCHLWQKSLSKMHVLGP